MTLSLIKPSGWAFGEILTSDQMEALDASQARAIDGTGGGTYAPSAAIVINGAGLQVNNLTVTGALTLNGNTTIGNSSLDALTVVATSTFAAAVTLNDALTANDTADFFGNVNVHTGASFRVRSNSRFGDTAADTFDVYATATFNGPVTFADPVEVGGPFQTNNDATLGSSSNDELSINASLVTPLAFAALGRVPFRAYGTLPNSSVTLYASDGQVFRINMNTTGIRTYTLSPDGASDGDWMLFWEGASNESIPAFGTNITSNIPSQSLTGASHFNNSSNSQWALYIFHEGGWYKMNFES